MAGADESMYARQLAGSRASRLKAAAGFYLLPAAREESLDFADLHGLYWRVKRPVGLVISFLAAIVCLPAVALIALVLARRGNAIFIRRKRLGLHGKPFTSYYFRTMVPDSLRTLGCSNVAEPAVTTDAFGRFLKKTRADRLPLFWNVLRGDMNLVGPKPLSQEELFGSGRAARHTLSVRPGLTGLWWVNGETDLRRRLALDRSYIEHASFLLDIRIFLRTLGRMHGL